MRMLKVFKDLVAFLTIIPSAKDESFVETSARYMFLFPLIGGFIGLLAAIYFQLCTSILQLLTPIIRFLMGTLENTFIRIFSACATISFILVLTGLQHFDGLVDLGNALGLKNLEERRRVAHAWIVTYKGAFLALFIEFLAFIGIFLINAVLMFKALICAEVSAKLSMVVLACIGKPARSGLGALFMKYNRGVKPIIAAYVVALLIIFPLFGFSSVMFLLVSFLASFLLEKVSNKVFGGVSGDVIGATNEIVRAICLLMVAGGVA